MRNIIIFLVLILALSGCSAFDQPGRQVDSAYGYAPQNFAGINQVWIDTNDDGTPNVVVTGGKEQEEIEVKGTIFGEEFTYKAAGVRAFDGIKFRAELEAIIAQEGNATIRAALTEMIPGLVEAAVRVAAGGGVPSLP